MLIQEIYQIFDNYYAKNNVNTMLAYSRTVHTYVIIINELVLINAHIIIKNGVILCLIIYGAV